MRMLFPAATLVMTYLILAPVHLYAASNLDSGGMSPERKDEMCIVYSNDAGRKAQEAQQLGCPGFSGPVWSLDTAGHMRWCLAADEIIVAREQRERANALERCEYCAKYADTAVDQENENRNFQCGLVGPRWQDDRSAHLKWCIGLEHIWGVQGHADYEESTRRVELSTCECQRYADEAVRAASENRDHNCGLTGPGGRWLIDHDAHFKWCFSVGTTDSTAETQARKAALAVCDVKRGRTLGKKRNSKTRTDVGQ